MKIITPSYYPAFKCIADKCRHSCCVGWEIDIDEYTYNMYKAIGGEFGERLSKNIYTDDCGAHFLMDSDERCPFLKENGLCDLICELGEKSLCSICADHPRFRNYFSDRVEMGLGMCCEEAARIILTCEESFQTYCEDDDGVINEISDEERIFFEQRDKVFEILLNKNNPLSKRIEELCYDFEVKLPEKTNAGWAEFLSGLECLDSEWLKYVSDMSLCNKDHGGFFDKPEWRRMFENLFIYFIYRHLPKAVGKSIGTYISFSLISCHIIRQLCISQRAKKGDFTTDDMIEICRMFSSEIEYSDDNTQELIMEIEFE
ncbi:MAG: flagellin lysine-N-methylase [Clostridia bacterium]|nr:flagellin lysine-N-methylase [Clostridia bacterium]